MSLAATRLDLCIIILNEGNQTLLAQTVKNLPAMQET